MKLSKKTWDLYLIWVFIHFILLILPKDEAAFYYQHRQFWPFGEGSYSETYDISEFLIYSSVPLVIFYAQKLIKDENS